MTADPLMPSKISVAAVLLAASAAAASTISLPADTPVYLVTKQEIIAKKRDYAVGDLIPVQVWRDVIVNGRTNAMPAQKDLLTEDRIRTVVAYVLSLQEN